MSIHVIISIDDDRWAKHPYGVSFDDEECNAKYRKNGLDSREECYRLLERVREAGYDLDNDIEEVFY